MSNEVYLSVIIPCYNEQENLIHGVLDEALSYLKTLNFGWELIISDDGSTDGSKKFIKEFLKGKTANIRLLENQHGGKPAAILAGVREAKGRFILFTDMDQSTPLTELQKLLPYFEKHGIVIGSRKERKNFPLYRKIGSKVFRIIRQTMLLRKINDTQCGFKALRTDLARQIFPKLEFFQQQQEVTGWKVSSFDVELLHLAQKAGYQIKEILVEWEDRDLAKNKQKSYFKESKEMLMQVIKVKINELQGKYKKIK